MAAEPLGLVSQHRLDFTIYDWDKIKLLNTLKIVLLFLNRNSHIR